MSRGAACPDEPPTEANQYQTRCTASGPTPIQPDGTSGRASSPDVQKSPAWCMIRVSDSIKSMPPVKRRMVPMGFALLKHDDDSGAAV